MSCTYHGATQALKLDHIRCEDSAAVALDHLRRVLHQPQAVRINHHVQVGLASDFDSHARERLHIVIPPQAGAYNDTVQPLEKRTQLGTHIFLTLSLV